MSDLRSDTERIGPRSSRLVVIFVLASIVFAMTTLEAADDVWPCCSA